MIKSKKELMLIGFISFISSAVSYVFTILMLMSFAETGLEKFLYFCCGVIIDAVKWFSLITLIKYYRAKIFKNFIAYCFLFFLFAGMSMIASISFSIFTVKKQMYDIKIIENTVYQNTISQIEKLNADIAIIETEKTNEVQRLNSELDGISLNYISRRQQLSDKKVELISFYDTRIDNLKSQLNIKTQELNTIEKKETEIKTLKNNAIAGFFETISSVINISIDKVILVFAIALGVILDTASIALTFDSTFSYQNKRSFNKDINKFKRIRIMKKELKEKLEESESDHEDKTDKIINFSDFIDYIESNELDLSELNFSKFKDLMPKSSFYKFLNHYKELS